jgi:hypothetical protein
VLRTGVPGVSTRLLYHSLLKEGNGWPARNYTIVHRTRLRFGLQAHQKQTLVDSHAFDQVWDLDVLVVRMGVQDAARAIKIPLVTTF